MKQIIQFSVLVTAWFLVALMPAVAQSEIFNYKQALSGIVKNKTLTVNITSVNRTTGEVIFGGGDSRGPTTPGLFFTWIWGDGTTTNGFFPQTKRYTDVTRNYLVKVIATYSATEKDTAEVLVAFTKAKITPVTLDPKLKVYVPAQAVTLTSSNGYGIPPLRPFPDAFFTDVSRAEFEYLFHIGATIEYDFVNENIVLPNGKFEQYALRDSNATGAAYSLWYTRPVSFGVWNGFLKGLDSDFSSMYHEMAHNITLNFPASYQYGGKTDGPANAIFSEAIAQIFQHAAGYELINNYQKYGLDEAWLLKLKENFTSNVRFQRSMFSEYMNTGMAFQTYYDASKNDAQRSREVLRTFLTVPYMFFRYVEERNQGYRLPVKRLMQYLSRFNAEWLRRFDPKADTPAANTFRATLWVAAISYTFQRDLRADFQAIGYPISDSDWAYLNPSIFTLSTNTVNLPAVAGSASSLTVTTTADNWTVDSSQPWLVPNVTRGAGNQTVTLTAAANTSVSSRTAVVTFSANGFDNQIVTVVQAGLSPALTTSVNSLTLDAAGATASFSVSSTTSWTISGLPPWLSVSPVSGAGAATVTLTATANPQPAIRMATLTLTAGGLSPQTVTITQRGLLVLAVPHELTLTIYPNPATTDLYLTELPTGSLLRVYDLQGRLYHSGSATYSLPVSNLPAGTYLLHIDGQGQQAVHRFQKQ